MRLNGAARSWRTWSRDPVALFVVTVVMVSLVTFLVSSLLPSVYEAKATLAVNQAASPATFVPADTLQQEARTLATLASNDTVAATVVRNLPFQVSVAGAKEKMSFTPVNETPLISLTASDENPQRATELANTWATAFSAYAGQRLRGVSPLGVEVASAASVPDSPTRPKPLLYTLLGAVFGAVLGAVLVSMRHTWRRWAGRTSLHRAAGPKRLPYPAHQDADTGVTPPSPRRFESNDSQSPHVTTRSSAFRPAGTDTSAGTDA